MPKPNNIKNESDNSSYTFAVPKELKDSALEIQSAYGLRKLSDAVYNLILVGLKVYKQNPDTFIKTLQQ